MDPDVDGTATDTDPVPHGHHTVWADVTGHRPRPGATYGDGLARAVDRDRTGRDAYLATTFDDARRSELVDRLLDLAWGMPTPRDHSPGCWRHHARCALELAAAELAANPPA
jgi:hypothetical protein